MVIVMENMQLIKTDFAFLSYQLKKWRGRNNKTCNTYSDLDFCHCPKWNYLGTKYHWTSRFQIYFKNEYKRGLEDDQMSQGRAQFSQHFFLWKPSIVVNCIKSPGSLFYRLWEPLDWGHSQWSQLSQVTLQLTLDPGYWHCWDQMVRSCQIVTRSNVSKFSRVTLCLQI